MNFPLDDLPTKRLLSQKSNGSVVTDQIVPVHLGAKTCVQTQWHLQ